MIERFLSKLIGVNPQLAFTLGLAIAKYEAVNPRHRVRITEGRRSVERQKVLVSEGKSTTMNSRHLVGDAVDLHIIDLDTGQAVWDLVPFRDLAQIWKTETAHLDTTWGGDWSNLRDGPHFQID